MKLFNKDNSVLDHIRHNREQVQQYIATLSLSDLKNENLENDIYERCALHLPSLEFENVFQSEPQRKIVYHAAARQNVMMDVFEINVPIGEGEYSFLEWMPSSYTHPTSITSLEGSVRNGLLVILYQEPVGRNFGGEHLAGVLRRIVELLQTNYGNLQNDFNKHNSDLRQLIPQAVEQRRKQSLHMQSVIEKSGIPIKRHSGAQAVMPIEGPTRRTLPILTTSASNVSPVVHDPTLAEASYNEIIRSLLLLGSFLEKHPSTYKDKGEEDLRDLFLAMLTVHYEVGATGESFNRSGKTDILVVYQGQNLFVAECKFWTGAKGFLETVDQLLRYLTWRDSKTALVIFVKRQGFQAPLESMRATVREHGNFLRVDEETDAFTRVTLYLPGDTERKISCSILMFHLPVGAEAEGDNDG